MDSRERLVAEKQSVTTHGATSLTPQCVSPSPSEEQDRVKGCAMPSAVQLPEGGLSVCDYIKDMDKKEWIALCQATSGPVSRVEFFKLCRSIIQVVSQSTLKVVVPAVVRLLSKDIEDIPASNIVDRADKHHSETSCRSQTSSSVSYFGDEEDVMIFKHGVLVDIVPKEACSSLPSEVAEADSPQLSGKRSRSSVGASSVNVVLKSQYTISLENIHQCLQEKLNKLEGVGRAANLEYLTGAIVKEVIDTVNIRIAKALNVSHAHMETTTRELVHNVTSLVEAHVISATGTISAVVENELDSALALTTGKAMNSVLCAAETCRNKKLKSLLASMKKALRVLTGHKVSAGDTQTCQTEEPAETYICDKESEFAEKLFSNEFQATVTEEVSLMLLKLAQSLIGPVMSGNRQDYSPASDTVSAASRAVEMTLEGVQCLVCSTPAQDTLTEDFKVWSTTRDVFSRLQLQLKHFFTKLSSRQRQAEQFAFSKEVVSHVLVVIQSEVTNSSDVSCDDEVQILKDVIISLTESVGKMTNGAGQEQQRLDSALSAGSQGSWSNWSEETLPEAASPVLPEISTNGCMVADAVLAENMDSNALPQDKASYIPHETVVSAVNSITEKFSLRSEESSTLHYQGNLRSVCKRLEKSLSQGTITSSRDLIEEIYQLLLKGRQTAAAGKSASAPALAALTNASDAPEGVTATEILGQFTQESIRSLFLPCFQLPSSWKTGLEAPLKLAAASLSCPGGLSFMARKGQNCASESPSQILSGVLQVAMDVMAKDVMNILCLTLRSSENLETFVKSSSTPDFEGCNTPGSGCMHDVMKCVDSKEDITDYSSLVAVLMIRLLTNLQNEESLSDDMLDKCRTLIDKTLSELVTAGGVARTDPYPAGIKIRKVLRVIYKDLMSEFGSKNRLLKALYSMDPLVEMTVVRSLISETMTDVTDKNVTKPQKTKKRRGFLKFLPSMRKITSCLKKKKSDNQNKENTDGSAALSTTDNNAGAECCDCVVPDDDKPFTSSGSSKKKRSLFTKVISFFKRRAFTVSSEQFT